MRIRMFRLCACAALIGTACLTSRPAARQITPFPSGLPFHDPVPDTYRARDLRVELKNKMTGTYAVVSIGDMFWRTPVGEGMRPALADLLRKADTTFGIRRWRGLAAT